MQSTDRDRDEVGPATCAVKAVKSTPAKSRTKRSAPGQRANTGKASREVPDALHIDDGKGQAPTAAEASDAVPDPSPKGRAGHKASAEMANQALPVSATLDQLAELQVRRKFYIGVTNKQTNAAKALVRRALGWRYDEEEGDREKTNGRAARIVAAALGGKEQKPEDVEAFAAVASDLAVVRRGIAPGQQARHQVEKDMKRLVRALPIYGWAKDVHGLGELGLAVVLAEVGDLSKYPKKGHLWKRLGLAPHDGKAYSTWRSKGGLAAEDWTAAGYSPRRRAEMHAVIAEPLFRQQTVVSGPYRAIYDRRKAATEVAHGDWTKMHRHMDALRVMTKYLVRDLWVAWRRAVVDVPDRARLDVPAAEICTAQLAKQEAART